MPFVILFFYMLAEFLAFWAVASLIGFGWALVALLATVVLGLVITRVELRRVAATQASLVQRLQAQRRGRFGNELDDEQLQTLNSTQSRKSAGDIGLTLAGALLLSIPGFATAIIGLLLVFPLTRPIIRGFLLGRMQRSVEKLGVRFFEASPTGRKTASYGSFGFVPGHGGAAKDSQSDDFHGSGSAPDAAQFENSDLDEEELRTWAESMRPEDFTSGESSSKDKKDDED